MWELFCRYPAVTTLSPTYFIGDKLMLRVDASVGANHGSRVSAPAKPGSPASDGYEGCVVTQWSIMVDWDCIP